jgi:thymidylate synthase (FAD)
MSLTLTIPVLDHGFVALRNISGPTRRIDLPFDAKDTDPANTARMSFNQTDNDRPESLDLKLADYLMRNHHTTPFEMIEVWLEMKMPIFIARQFVRHRTVSINEVSGRYVTLPNEYYVPAVVGGKAPNAKQGQEDNLSEEQQERFRMALRNHCSEGYALYLEAIKEGVAPEHARMLLSLNHYTHWIWKQDIHNLLHFLRLRDHSHAQVEAQQYAQAIDQLIRQVLPHTMELYDKYRRQSTI